MQEDEKSDVFERVGANFVFSRRKTKISQLVLTSYLSDNKKSLKGGGGC